MGDRKRQPHGHLLSVGLDKELLAEVERRAFTETRSMSFVIRRGLRIAFGIRQEESRRGAKSLPEPTAPIATAVFLTAPHITPWTAIQYEIEQALETIRYEQPDGHDSESRKRLALDHLRTAILLMTGTDPNTIKGHQPGRKALTE